jgi:hypothetical protein
MDRFNADLNNFFNKKGLNNSFLTKLKYDQLISHIIKLKNN